MQTWLKTSQQKLSGALVAALFAAACGGSAQAPSRAELLSAQQAAHAAWAYTMGNESKAPASAEARALLLELRAGIAAESVHVLSVESSVVQGLTASIYKLYGSTAQHPDAAALIDAIGDALENGAPHSSEFFAATHGTVVANGVSYNVRGVDPEPAQTTASLTGTSGPLDLGTAPAVYVNSGQATTVRKWPTPYTTGGANPPTPGQPCSPGDLAAGAQATQAIFQNGTLFKCL